MECSLTAAPFAKDKHIVKERLIDNGICSFPLHGRSLRAPIMGALCVGKFRNHFYAEFVPIHPKLGRATMIHI